MKGQHKHCTHKWWCTFLPSRNRVSSILTQCSKNQILDLKDYKEYQELFKDDLVVAVRKLLNRIEKDGEYNLEDSTEHNNLKRYFNKFALNKKITEEQFKTWK